MKIVAASILASLALSALITPGAIAETYQLPVQTSSVAAASSSGVASFSPGAASTSSNVAESTAFNEVSSSSGASSYQSGGGSSQSVAEAHAASAAASSAAASAHASAAASAASSASAAAAAAASVKPHAPQVIYLTQQVPVHHIYHVHHRPVQSHYVQYVRGGNSAGPVPFVHTQTPGRYPYQ